MDLSLAEHHICRICLSTDAYDDFIEFKGSKAEIFKEAAAVQLTIDDVKIESVICQHCFKELENFLNSGVNGTRADRENFVIQRRFAATQRMSNEVKLPEDEAIEPYPPSKVKHEPPVEFVLILPTATINQPEDEEDDIKRNRKWVKSVQLTKFDVKWHKESTPFQTFRACKHCRLVVKYQGHLTQHLKACGKIITARFECDNCGERVQNKSTMKRHMLKHSNERNFRCTECGNEYKSKGELMRHKKIHDKPIACETCQKKFALNRTLKGHQMQHRHGVYATQQEETFDCKKCDKSFSILSNLRQHQTKVHDEDEVKCGVCGKICKNRALMLYHNRTHAKVECSICHKKISKNKLALHVRSHSSHFECDLCDQSCNYKSSLKRHIERSHLLKRLVKDSKCRADFSDFGLLQKLQLKHGSSSTFAEKKFHCDKCGESFATPNTLKNHKQQVHPEKLFDCEFCKKTFKTKSHLKHHKARVHPKMPVK